MQRPSRPTTRYEVEVAKKPTEADGYVQRIEIWEALKELGSANRAELHRKLLEQGHQRPLGASMDESYVRIELTDMCKRGFVRRISD